MAGGGRRLRRNLAAVLLAERTSIRGGVTPFSLIYIREAILHFACPSGVAATIIQASEAPHDIGIVFFNRSALPGSFLSSSFNKIFRILRPSHGYQRERSLRRAIERNK